MNALETTCIIVHTLMYIQITTHLLTFCRLLNLMLRDNVGLRNWPIFPSVHYKPGKSNSDADTLSKMSLDLEDLGESYREVESSIELTAFAYANMLMENQGDFTVYCDPVFAMRRSKFWLGK